MNLQKCDTARSDTSLAAAGDAPLRASACWFPVEVPTGIPVRTARSSAQEFIAKNPAGGLPFIELKSGVCIAETVAIAAYLEEAEGTNGAAASSTQCQRSPLSPPRTPLPRVTIGKPSLQLACTASKGYEHPADY